MTNPVIGIISYMPDKEADRVQRMQRFERLLTQLKEFWPSLPIMVIAQNWKAYHPNPRYNVVSYSYEKLGILKARKTLRERFLESTYDYLIMFDDDAIIERLTPNANQEYLDAIDANPDKFMFLQYASSQLNGCAISKRVYSEEPMVDYDAEKNEGFEDSIFSWLLHNKYPEKEFSCTCIKCVHFRNPSEYVVSTWAQNGVKDWKGLRERTSEVKKYITEHKDLPKSAWIGDWSL